MSLPLMRAFLLLSIRKIVQKFGKVVSSNVLISTLLVQLNKDFCLFFHKELVESVLDRPGLGKLGRPVQTRFGRAGPGEGRPGLCGHANHC